MSTKPLQILKQYFKTSVIATLNKNDRNEVFEDVKKTKEYISNQVPL